MTAKRNKRERLSLDLPKVGKEQMENLCTKANCSSLTDLIKKAVQFYDDVEKLEAEGGQLIFRHQNGKDEIIKFSPPLRAPTTSTTAKNDHTDPHSTRQ